MGAVFRILVVALSKLLIGMFKNTPRFLRKAKEILQKTVSYGKKIKDKYNQITEKMKEGLPDFYSMSINDVKNKFNQGLELFQKFNDNSIKKYLRERIKENEDKIRNIDRIELNRELKLGKVKSKSSTADMSGGKDEDEMYYDIDTFIENTYNFNQNISENIKNLNTNLLESQNDVLESVDLVNDSLNEKLATSTQLVNANIDPKMEEMNNNLGLTNEKLDKIRDELSEKLDDQAELIASDSKDEGYLGRILDTAITELIKAIGFLAGMIITFLENIGKYILNLAIKGLNKIIDGLNKIPGVNIEHFEEFDYEWEDKDKKRRDKGLKINAIDPTRKGISTVQAKARSIDIKSAGQKMTSPKKSAPTKKVDKVQPKKTVKKSDRADASPYDTENKVVTNTIVVPSEKSIIIQKIERPKRFFQEELDKIS